MAKLGKTPKHCTNSVNYSQGSGYYIPDSMSVSKWREIKQKWDQQLKQSGFVDIEMSSSALDGHFLPTFSQNSIEKNYKTQQGAVGDGIEGYFSYCSTFYELADFKLIFNSKKWQRKWALMREIFRLHKDGVSYSDMRLALQGRQTSYMKRFNVPASHKKFRQQRSKYWLFIKTSSILEQMWYWHATDQNGSLTPYDLTKMQCTGLTSEVIARAIATVAENTLK